MNNKRRKRVGIIIDRLLDLSDELTQLCYEEGDCYYNLPDGIRKTDKSEGMMMASASFGLSADTISAVCKDLRDIITT